MLLCIVPFLAAYLFLFATRESIAKAAQIGDLPTAEEILDSSDASEKVDDVMLHGRDAHLVMVIADMHNKSRHEPLRVGILFGAAHMRAVCRYLTLIRK